MSYNYGAGNYAGPPTFKRLLIVTLTATCSAFLCVLLFPGLLARIFTPQEGDDPAGLPGHALILRRDLGLWGTDGLSDHLHVPGAGPHQPLPRPSAQGDPAGPLALILPRITGSVFGIFVAEPIADILASVTTPLPVPAQAQIAPPRIQRQGPGITNHRPPEM